MRFSGLFVGLASVAAAAAFVSAELLPGFGEEHGALAQVAHSRVRSELTSRSAPHFHMMTSAAPQHAIEMQLKFREFSSSVHAALSTAMRVQDQASCQNAALALMSSPCFTSLFGAMGGGATSFTPAPGNLNPFAQLQSMMSGLCAPGCDLMQQLATVSTACSGDAGASFASQKAMFDSMGLNEYLPGGVGCIRDTDGSLCINKFFNATGVLSAGAAAAAGGAGIFGMGGAMTDAALAQLCNPCVQKIATSIGSNSGSSQAMGQSLSFLCTRDPSNDAKFCVNQVGSIVNELHASTSSDSSTLPVSVCQPCFRRMWNQMNEMGTATASMAGMDKMFDALCTVDASGKRCINSLNSLMSTLNASKAQMTNVCPSPTVSPAVCTGNCKSMVQLAFSGFGCCLATIISTLRDAQTTDKDKAEFGMVQSFFGACGLDATNACAFAPPVAVVVPLNLNYDFYSKNRASLDTALIADFAAATGAAAASVKVDVTKSASGTVSVSFTVTMASTLDTNALAASISQQTGANGAGLGFPSTQKQVKALDATQAQQPLMAQTAQTSGGGIATTAPPNTRANAAAAAAATASTVVVAVAAAAVAALLN